jgi:uncharacterized protein (TIGR02391 family)
MRGIALFSRGKLVNAPEYFSESTSSHFYQYLTGWIQADFIDLLDEDVISTNRQALNWDHPDMSKFRRFLAALINEVGQEWRRKRSSSKNREVEQATGIDKAKWFSTLPSDIRDSVESIVNKMEDSEDVAESFAPVVKALYSIVPEYPLLHWRHLHGTIKEGVLEYYKNGQYGHAADQGAKLYAEKIRKISSREIDGTQLADVFSFEYDSKTSTLTKSPAVPVNDLTTDSLRNIQAGQGFLTRGLMHGFRNPINHSPMSSVVPGLISEIDCLNILSLVSYLSTKLEFSEPK